MNNQILNMLGEIIGVSDIMFATTAANSNTPNQLNGSVTLNLGIAESGEMFSGQAELWSPSGILSVPMLPASANNNVDAAQALYFNVNDQKVVFATRDTRAQGQAGNINAGETVVYAPGSNASTLYKNDGSITHMTTSAADSTQNVYLKISPAGLQFVAPWGNITFDATGFHINTISGAAFDLGGVSLPGPLATLAGNYATITASNTTISSPFINIGDGTNPPFISSALPITIGSSTSLSLAAPLLNIGDLTTLNAITMTGSLISLTATGAATLTAGGAVGITAGAALGLQSTGETSIASSLIEMTAAGAIIGNAGGAVELAALGALALSGVAATTIAGATVAITVAPGGPPVPVVAPPTFTVGT
jgi:hypothetical protein